jgi:hypothetical protein
MTFCYLFRDTNLAKKTFYPKIFKSLMLCLICVLKDMSMYSLSSNPEHKEAIQVLKSLKESNFKLNLDFLIKMNLKTHMQ